MWQLELRSVYLSRDIKAVSGLYGQRMYILELLVKTDISCVLHVSFEYFVFVDQMSADSVWDG
jgi:hypothetical protein